MKILFLVESTENLTACNLIYELKRTGYEICVIPYFLEGKDQCSIVTTLHGQALSYSGELYAPYDFDGALLWSWGTASLGRKYLRLFEESGVEVLNSTYLTETTDSKIKLASLLNRANIPIPKTACLESVDSEVFIELQKMLGPLPYVFKPDYGTRGEEVQFVFTAEDVQRFTEQLSEQLHKEGFILQEFIGDPAAPISHYRVLVIGGEVFPIAMKVTAKELLQASNVFNGGSAEFIKVPDDLRDIADKAVRASGLNVAGVDIMKSDFHVESAYIVLEVNDGPGTKTFDQAGYDLSATIVQYFIEKVRASSDAALLRAGGQSSLTLN